MNVPGGLTGEQVAPRRPPLSAPAQHRQFALIVGALMVVAAALVWYRIGTDSFWFDEGLSVRHARENSWAEMLGTDSGNMPLYIGLLKLWLEVADSEATIRLFSAIPFVLTVPVVALIGRRTSGNAAGVLAAAIVATHPFLLRYGGEARGFALVTLLVSAGVLGLVAGVQDDSRAKLIAGIVALALAPYAHSVAGLAGVALIAWMLYLPSEARPLPLRWVACTYGVIVAPLVLVLASAGPDTLFWTKQDFARSVPSVAWHIVSDTPAVVVIGGFAIAGVVLAVQVVRREGRSAAAWVAGVPVVWALGTSVLVLAVSLRRSIVVPRYLLVIVPAVALLAAGAATRLTWRKRACALIAIAVVVNAGVVVNRGGEYRGEDWRQAQGFVAAHARPGDGIVFAPTHKTFLYEHYQTRSGATLPEPVLPGGTWGDLPYSGTDLHRDQIRDVDAVTDAVDRHERIWVVQSSGPPGGPTPAFLAHLKTTLDAYGTVEDVATFGDVVITRYDRST